MLSFLPMVFLSEGDNFRYKFDIDHIDNTYIND